jgi:hypothetical protein
MNDLLSGYRLGDSAICKLKIQLPNGVEMEWLPKTNQIIVWVTISEPNQPIDPRSRAIPAIVDTGFGANLLIGEYWLRQGVGLTPSKLCLRNDQVREFDTPNGKLKAQSWELDIWGFPQIGGPVPKPSQLNPKRLGAMPRLVHVVPIGKPCPSLPLLGAGLFERIGMSLEIKAGLVNLSLG